MSSAWDDKDFPDAIDGADVEWMMVEWRIMRDDNKCADCGGNYSLNPNQFEDLPLGVNQGQAIMGFREFVKNRRENVSVDPDAPVQTTMFLLKVVKVAKVTDKHRALLPDVEIDI